MKRILALFAVASLALPVQAQFNPLAPAEIPDTVYYEGEILVGGTVESQLVVRGLRRFTAGAQTEFGRLIPDPDPYGVHWWIKHGNAEYQLNNITQCVDNDENDLPYRCAYRNPDNSISYGNTLSLRFLQNTFDFPVDSLKKYWDHFVKTGSVVVNKDTFLFKDNWLDGYGGAYLVVSWLYEKSAWEVDDLIKIIVKAKPYFVPESPSSTLRVWQNKFGGVPIAGEVWLSWGIPYMHPDTAEQLRLEKKWNIQYEYRALRDGDKNWKPMFFPDTRLDGVEQIQTIFGDLYYQRRRYLVSGLDPGGEYSFCVRAVGAEAGPELCNFDVITPVSIESGELPETMRLAQNYPNPFNPSTAIRYELPAAEHVRLDVFDVSGRNVKVLVDGTRPAGTHTARFDAGGLPSGLYVYRLQAGGNTIVKTMHLIR